MTRWSAPRIGRGTHAAAVRVSGPVLCLLLALALASAPASTADVLSGAGLRTNLQVALWETGIPGEKEALQQLVFGFQRANPDVIVCLEWQDVSLQDEWTRRWCGGQREYAPDVTVMTERRAWEHRHELLDLPDDLGRQLRRDFEPAVMRRLPGSARGVPWSVATYALYYRPDLFEDAELALPRTLDALAECAEALADPPRRFGLGLPQPLGGGSELLHALALAIGQAPAREDADGNEEPEAGQSPRPDEPDYASALELLLDMQSRGALQPETLTWTDGELLDLFVEGRLAMLIAPISAARTLRGAEAAPEWAAAPLPVADEGMGHLSSEWMVIFGSTNRRDNATRLLRYIAERESQRMLAMMPGVPAMRSIADELRDQSPWRAHIAALEGAEGVPHARWDRLRPQLGEALAYALSGRLTPREALSLARGAGD
ncbi:MAG: ABC transporter substrate-binding protein [Armatimonadota bacterium]|jgi:ABC-type glycerol-3-phosphate transport system substrate-binding protein